MCIKKRALYTPIIKNEEIETYVPAITRIENPRSFVSMNESLSPHDISCLLLTHALGLKER